MKNLKRGLIPFVVSQANHLAYFVAFLTNYLAKIFMFNSAGCYPLRQAQGERNLCLLFEDLSKEDNQCKVIKESSCFRVAQTITTTLFFNPLKFVLTCLIAGIRPLLGPAQCCYEIGCTQFALIELQEKPLFPAIKAISTRVLSCNPLSRALCQKFTTTQKQVD